MYVHYTDNLWIKASSVLMCCFALSGCASNGVIARATTAALNAVGLDKPKPVDPSVQRSIALKIQADKLLNTDADHQPFSVIVRIYQLKQNSAFQQAFYDMFLDPQKEKQAFGSDVIAEKEIILIPGQTFTDTEKLDASADYLGIVALFQHPSTKKWKLTFPTKNLYKTGISMGLNACSITVSSGLTLEYNGDQQKALLQPTPC